MCSLRTDNLLFLIAFFFCNPVLFWSQNSSKEIAKADRYLEISDSLYDAGNIDAMVRYDSLALQIGNSQNNPYIKGKVYYQKGRFFWRNQNTKKRKTPIKRP